MQLGTILPAGKTQLTFYAEDPSLGSNTTSCNLIISILDIENPKVSGCPTNMEYTLPKGASNQLVFWKEPQFTDNVGVSTLYKSRVRVYSLSYKKIMSLCRNLVPLLDLVCIMSITWEATKRGIELSATSL
jgi:hypothetical protein